MNKDILLISFSAFFADLGYQMIQAIFPIYLVITLSSSPLLFGIANALAFGGGALLAYVGGILSDRYSRKWLAVIGSSFIILMSTIGLIASPVIAVALFTGGWWGRNFRVPPRRAMLTNSTRKKNLGKVFGFLHALDIGGGMFAVIVLMILLEINVSQKSIILATAIPIVVSILLLLITSDIRKSRFREGKQEKSSIIQGNKKIFNGIIFATALYGFSYYSLGFPILTIAQTASSNLLGIGSYGVYLGVSAVTGYFIGTRRRLNKIKTLGYLGYILSGAGTAMLALAYGLHFGISAFYLGVAVMGFGLGVVETMEPTIISLVWGGAAIGKGMGALQGSRSLGIFFGNLIMGILYVSSPAFSYTYAAAVSIIAGIIVLYFGIGFKQ